MANNIWNNPALNPTGMNFNNPYFNNGGGNMLPHYEVIQVNGENGADAFQMGPNSSVLLLDKTAPIVWLIQTDGAGYKTKTPYSISPYQAKQPVDLDKLQQRVAQLEELINARYQSNDRAAKPKKTRTNVSEQPDVESD